MLRLLAIALLMSTPALAHDQWKNGDPVPAWVKTSCCGAADAHQLDPADVWQDNDGNYHVRGNTSVVPASQILPSQDGEYWAFYASPTSGIYCLFIPMSG